MTRRDRMRGTLWFVFTLCCLAASFAAAFGLTHILYRLIGWAPPALALQVGNSMLGLFITGLTIYVLTSLFRPRFRRGELGVYGPIIEALNRIAQGDFTVRVDSLLDERSPSSGILGDLIQTVNRTAVELNQMESLRQEFISNVSHEIQSPLTSIRGFAQALQNDRLSVETRHHYLTIIETESQRLSKLTDNLLKLAALEADQAKFEPVPYRLDRQIRDLILVCEPQWTAKALDLDVALDAAEIDADQDLLSQVWINLIHNAIKFTPEGGQIRVGLAPCDDGLEFTLSDTGPGISEEDQARIFERFFKSDKSRTRSDSGGSGLGLSITHKIVEMHHGTIEVRSAPGEGTTFTVHLPREQPAAPDPGDAAPSSISLSERDAARLHRASRPR